VESTVPLDGLMSTKERDFELPGRSVVLGTRCMAATSHPLATATALDILRRGGNAVDAAVAAAAVLGVVEPTQTGIGGDCFALYMPKGQGIPLAINGSGWAPRAAATEWFIERGISAIDPASPHSVTVPGAVSAWECLARDHGTLGIDRLLAPAIRAAEEGYPVTERVARDWRRQTAKLARPGAASVFLHDGAPPVAGALHRQPKLAKALRAIAKEGAQAFYGGWIAEDLVACLKDLGGLHTVDDFAAFQPEYVAPIRAAYRGYDIWECPPNGQGLTPLLMARMLERYDIGALQVTGGQRLHLLAEIARVAYGVRDSVIGDPRAVISDSSSISNDSCAGAVDRLLADRYIDTLVARVAGETRIAHVEPPSGPAHRDTVFLTVVDRDLNTIAFINSIFDDFGSGIVAPASGIVLHNRGSGFVVEPGHPNTIAGHKRPLHTIIPALLTRNNRAVLPFGVTGGHFQPIGQMQLLSNLIDHGMSLQQAIDQPRIFARGNLFEVERLIPRTSLEALGRLGHSVTYAENPLGTAQAIRIDWESGVLHGGADGRRDGVALGW
jgi:gamma-glutamyltranspeptidase/glutathione hydrolase